MVLNSIICYQAAGVADRNFYHSFEMMIDEPSNMGGTLGKCIAKLWVSARIFSQMNEVPGAILCRRIPVVMLVMSTIKRIESKFVE